MVGGLDISSGNVSLVGILEGASLLNEVQRFEPTVEEKVTSISAHRLRTVYRQSPTTVCITERPLYRHNFTIGSRKDQRITAYNGDDNDPLMISLFEVVNAYLKKIEQNGKK